MLERLKKLLSQRSGGAEVEYHRGDEPTSPVVPAGPPSAPFPPVAPLERPAQDDAEQQ